MASIKELRTIVAKSKSSHFAPRHDIVVRRISIYFTWLILKTPLSANAVTILQTVVGFIGGLLLTVSDYRWTFAGIMFLQFGYVLDCCDGEVARYRKQSSVNGVFLDLIGHEIVVPTMYMGLAIGEFLRFGRIELLIFGFFAGIFSLRFDLAALFQTVNTLIMKADNASYDFDALSHQSPSKTTQIATSRPSLLRVIFRYPESMNLITVIILFDWLGRLIWLDQFTTIYTFLIIFGTMVPLARIYSIYSIFKQGEVDAKYREIIIFAKKK